MLQLMMILGAFCLLFVCFFKMLNLMFNFLFNRERYWHRDIEKSLNGKLIKK